MNRVRKKWIDLIITILCAIGGFFASCTTTYIIQKGNGKIEVEQTTKTTQQADSTRTTQQTDSATENFRNMEVFKIRPINEEKNDFIITVGNHLATEEHFKTEKEAEDYIKEKPLDMMIALIAEMIHINENKDKSK